MRLRQATIEGYRSVRKELRLFIEERTTIILGANDHGKTNVLSALRHLNAEDDFTAEDLNWDCETKPNDFPKLSFTIEFEADERNDLHQLVNAAIRKKLARAFVEDRFAELRAESAEATTKKAAASKAEQVALAAQNAVAALGDLEGEPTSEQLKVIEEAHTTRDALNVATNAATHAEGVADKVAKLAALAHAYELRELADIAGEQTDDVLERKHQEATQLATRLSAAAKRSRSKADASSAAHHKAVEEAAADEEIERLSKETAKLDTEAKADEANAAKSSKLASEFARALEAFTLSRDGKLAFPKDQVPPKPDTVELDDIPTAIVFDRVGVGGKRTRRPVQRIDDAALDAYLDQRLPKVELIGPEQKVADVATRDTIGDEGNDFMRGIFHYAGLHPTEWERIFDQGPRTEKQLEEASKELNRTLRASWSQGADLSFRLSHRNGEIDLQIDDEAVEGRFVPPSRRSSGFTHFFALKTMLYARECASGASRFVWLFDEPGLYLHPQAQHDLLQTLETLAISNQVVYTTHSIFLLNKNHPTRHRLLKKDKKGTRVDSKPYSGRWQAAIDALGLALPGTVLFASKVLLVEGDSDPILINATLQKLIELGKIDMDINSLSIMGTGDLKHADALIRMLTETALKPEIAILVDGDGGGKARIDGLKKLIQAHKIKTSEFDDGAELEDYLIRPRTLLPQALAEYLGHLDLCPLDAAQAAKAVATEVDADPPPTKKISTWLGPIGQKVGKLDEEPSKVGIARQYLLSLQVVEELTEDELIRPLALAAKVNELLKLPTETIESGTILGGS